MGSAVMTKRAGRLPALMGTERGPATQAVGFTRPAAPEALPVPEPVLPVSEADAPTPAEGEWDPQTRWFDGRPVRPARTIVMRVTGYSPDHRSCGEFADGQTATLHSVWTNGMRLVAADPKVLPYGSLLTVPGYADGEIVPVLDCGGAIKGARLDLLFPTHETARRWGVQDVKVVVWEYADGEPAPDPRKVR